MLEQAPDPSFVLQLMAVTGTDETWLEKARRRLHNAKLRKAALEAHSQWADLKIRVSVAEQLRVGRPPPCTCSSTALETQLVAGAECTSRQIGAHLCAASLHCLLQQVMEDSGLCLRVVASPWAARCHAAQATDSKRSLCSADIYPHPC